MAAACIRRGMWSAGISFILSGSAFGRADDPTVLWIPSKSLIGYLERDLPQGPCWRRYNHDGYGQKDDGSAFDGTGVGRCWPILTGERGHYELAAGRDPKPFIAAMEKFANAGRDDHRTALGRGRFAWTAG